MSCLPFSGKVFRHTGQALIIDETTRIATTEDKYQFSLDCLQDVSICSEEYLSGIKTNNRFENCNFISDLNSLVINCEEPSNIITSDGREILIGDQPKSLSLNSLPIKIGTKTLRPSDIFVAIKAKTQTLGKLANIETNDTMTQKARVNSPKALSPRVKEPTLVNDFQEFVSLFIVDFGI